MDAYGYIEVLGLVPAVVAADAAAKAAVVEIVGKQNTGAGMISVLFKGEIGAVRASLEAAEEAVSAMGKVVNAEVIARPELGMEIMYQ